MSEGPGLTRLYKSGLFKDFLSTDLADAKAKGWKDEPQAASVATPKTIPTMQTSEVKGLR